MCAACDAIWAKRIVHLWEYDPERGWNARLAFPCEGDRAVVWVTGTEPRVSCMCAAYVRDGVCLHVEAVRVHLPRYRRYVLASRTDDQLVVKGFPEHMLAGISLEYGAWESFARGWYLFRRHGSQIARELTGWPDDL